MLLSEHVNCVTKTKNLIRSLLCVIQSLHGWILSGQTLLSPNNLRNATQTNVTK